MPLHINYIRAFLNRPGVEGPQALQGYIPCYKNAGGSANYKGTGDPAAYRAMGASGVTLATGVDLGQTNAATLAAYGLDAGIINFMRPYLGLKKQAALEKLHQVPLTVSPQTAAALDNAVHTGYLHKNVIPAYNKAAVSPFADLPKQAQAVIMSICFQKGVSGTRNTAPETWKHLCVCDWQAASDELIHGFKQYASRRAIEGRLLREVC